MNFMAFAGRLGRDAELKDAGQYQVCEFAVAVDVGFGDKKHTVWVDCAYWGKPGVAVQPYLTKGKAVSVSGEFDLETFTKRDKTPGAKITCRVVQVTLQSAKDDGAKASADTEKPAYDFKAAEERARQEREQAARARAPVAAGGFDDDDIPF